MTKVELYQCCHGYSRKPGEFGCPESKFSFQIHDVQKVSGTAKGWSRPGRGQQRVGHGLVGDSRGLVTAWSRIAEGCSRPGRGQQRVAHGLVGDSQGLVTAWSGTAKGWSRPGRGQQRVAHGLVGDSRGLVTAWSGTAEGCGLPSTRHHFSQSDHRS